jgi:hypothetical protein
MASSADINTKLPNEIIAMILSCCDPTDIPAVQRVCARWRDLAPEREPDVVLAMTWHQDEPTRLFVVPRARAQPQFINDLCACLSRPRAHCDGDEYNSFMAACNRTAQGGRAINTRRLFANLTTGGPKAQFFIADFDWAHYDYGVASYKDKEHFIAGLLGSVCRNLGERDETRSTIDLIADHNIDQVLAIIDNSL